MTADLVIGLDCSTQSTKAIAWTRDGEALAEGRADIAMASPHKGWAEQDVEDWWRAATAALNNVTSAVDPARIGGIAISNQRETIALVDEGLRAVRPAIVWLDERAHEDVAILSESFGAERLHRITGKPVDITPTVYRISWLARNEPDALERTAKLLDAHSFLVGRLAGEPVASWTSADPFGVFDIEAKAWAEPILSHLGLTADRFARLSPPGARIGAITEEAAAATGLSAGTSVFAGGGDGQCAGLGVNAVRPGAVYLNLGTAIITGAWSETARIGHYWRTMTSPTGIGFFLEGCQRAGAYFVNWFVDTFAGGRSDPAIFSRLEAEAAHIPIGSDGVIISPYLTGCMDPHWDPSARAAFFGLGPHHGLGHLYRASLEALTLESARCLKAMRANGVACERILAVGGGARSELWSTMIADATGLPLIRSRSLEASALGAGMSAAVGAGLFPDFQSAAAAMSGEGESVQPNADARVAWDRLDQRHSRAYPAAARATQSASHS